VLLARAAGQPFEEVLRTRLFEPLGIYGRWLKIKLFFQLFPLYKRATFKRQKIYVKSERNR